MTSKFVYILKTFYRSLHTTILELDEVITLFIKIFDDLVRFIWSRMSGNTLSKYILPLHCGVEVGQNKM